MPPARVPSRPDRPVLVDVPRAFAKGISVRIGRGLGPYERRRVALDDRELRRRGGIENMWVANGAEHEKRRGDTPAHRQTLRQPITIAPKPST